MNCNYKVKLDDIQNKYKFNIFCTGSYNDSDLRKMIENVFYALPRVNGSGTSVTLTDTAFSYMKNKLNATETSQEGTPTPETPQTIHTISGDNEAVVCGKNLLNPNDCYLFNSSKYIGTPSYASVGKIVVEPNTTYSLINDKTLDIPDFNIWEYDANNSNKTTATKTNTTSGDFRLLTFTTKNTTKYISFYEGGYVAYSSVNEMLDTLKLMLIKGNTAPSQYEPYKSNSVLLTLGDKEICKIGNYEDKIFKAIKGNEVYDSLASEEKATLDYGKWYLRKAIGKVVLDGSENWTRHSDTRQLYYISSSGLNIKSVSNNQTISALSNYFQALPYYVNGTDDIFGSETGIAYNTDQKLYFGTKVNTSITDLATFKTWASTHNISVCYPLATPTNELFNDAQQEQLEDIYNNMLSYEGQTNVSQVNEDLPFNINSTAIKDLNDL